MYPLGKGLEMRSNSNDRVIAPLTLSVFVGSGEARENSRFPR